MNVIILITLILLSFAYPSYAYIDYDNVGRGISEVLNQSGANKQLEVYINKEKNKRVPDIIIKNQEIIILGFSITYFKKAMIVWKKEF